ncbi:hypothetical protein [Paucimonas lemoignei]|uniref:hypothetical protein n=1 Tax=Paucimonas lemoignei TaxID=29443 RepID=UPI00104F6EB7|nr:hypothetical protein [Paucimonas lemoignei]
MEKFHRLVLIMFVGWLSKTVNSSAHAEDRIGVLMLHGNLNTPGEAADAVVDWIKTNVGK